MSITKRYVILCNPLHEGELHIVTRVDALGSETCQTGAEVKEGIVFDDFPSAVKCWSRCMRLDEHYFPWIAPFIAEVENGRIVAALVKSEFLEQARSEKSMTDVLDLIGVGFRICPEWAP